MRMPGASTARSISQALRRLGAAVVLLHACGGEPESTPVPLGEPIAIGSDTLEIVGAETAPSPPPPINIFRTRPHEKAFIVRAYWRGLRHLDLMERVIFAEEFLESRLMVEDQAGDRRAPVSAMQGSLVSMMDPGTDWQNWAVVFHVFEDARSPTLFVENPDPAEGQPSRVAVDLGLWEAAP